MDLVCSPFSPIFQPLSLPALVERLFFGIYYRKQGRDKTLAYAQSLLDWMEKAGINLSSGGMAWCITEIQEKMYGLTDITLKDFQALPVLDLATRSKSKPMPEAPQPKDKVQCPMYERGKGLREMHTASAHEGTATPTLPNAEGVKPPLGLGPSQRS